MQDPVLLPPLEHPPDQIALLPFETVRVMAVPCVNDACMELPTGTLMPAGLEITLSPVRPVADTVSVTVAGGGSGGFTVRVPIAVRPPAVANTESPVGVMTLDVGTEKLNVCCPAGTVTLGGGVAAELLDERLTRKPPTGAGFVKPMIAKAGLPPVTVFGKKPRLESAAGPRRQSGVCGSDNHRQRRGRCPLGRWRFRGFPRCQHNGQPGWSGYRLRTAIPDHSLCRPNRRNHKLR